MEEIGSRRSYWLREALAREATADAPALRDRIEADVTIVGGGYTGLWAAYQLTERAPGTRIVLLEQDICGGGPSGRNGGFLHGWWDQLPVLADMHGAEGALRLAWEADASVAGIQRWCETHAVDAWFRRGGYLRVSAAVGQDGDWLPAVEACQRLGVPDAFVPLTADEVRARCSSPRFRAGAFMPNAATIQPAILARAIRGVVMQRGVGIFEHTPVTRLHPGRTLRVDTTDGAVTSSQVILALNAWAAGWPVLRRRVLAWGSYIALTEPVPEVLSAMGWTGDEAITDSRFTVHYFRTTPDGRVAFGAGIGKAGFGGRIGTEFTQDRSAVDRTVAGMRHLLPALSDARIDDAWGGPIDVTPTRLPLIGSMHGGLVHYAHGYSGNGVGPSYLAGRILASLVDGARDDLVSLPIVGASCLPFPPEPFRYIGARVIRQAMVRHDEAGQRGARPSRADRVLAGLPRRMGYRLGPRG
jgi:glycine/D-amino acid oxidase-like deaminating enzyme